MINRRLITFISFCAVLLFGGALSATEDPIQSRGFRADHAFQYGNVDAVDTLTHNVVVPIPLGQTYSSNGSLSYGFYLTYNSEIWDHPQHVAIDALPLWGRSSFFFFNMNDGDNPPASEPGFEIMPARLNNAGLGWTLTLGELQDGIKYISPDGGTHTFYSKLHGDIEWDESGWPDVSHPLYTRDGTYLRLEKVAAGVRVVHFPDGTRKRFKCAVSNVSACESAGESYWLLDQISDPYGNVLWVQRPERPNGVGQTWTWTFNECTSAPGDPNDDGHVVHDAPNVHLKLIRSHQIDFTITGTWYYQYKATAVRLAGFSRSAANDPPAATFELQYTPADVHRGRGHTWNGPDLRVPFTGGSDPKIHVEYLSKILLPATGTRNGTEGKWQFDYLDHSPDPSDLLPFTIGNFTYKTSLTEGRLRSITLPTKGQIEYTWGPQDGFPMRTCDRIRTDRPSPRLEAGILTRKITRPDGSTDGKPWQYYGKAYLLVDTPPLNPDGTRPCNTYKEYDSVIIDPYGVTTVNFYSIYKDNRAYRGTEVNADGVSTGVPATWSSNDWGLPITKVETDGAGRYLSSSTYQCNAAQFFDAAALPRAENGPLSILLRSIVAHTRKPGDVPSCNTDAQHHGLPFRSRYLQNADSGLACDSTLEDCHVGQHQSRRANVRVTSERVSYDDGSFTTSDFSDFDGLGHQRAERTGGNFFTSAFQNVSGGDERLSITRYNPLFRFNAALQRLEQCTANCSGGSAVWQPGEPSPWVLETFSQKSAWERANGSPGAEAGVQRTTAFTFDTTTGRMTSKRAYVNGTSPGSRDVTTNYERSVANDPADGYQVVTTQEQYSGGDSPLGNGMSPPNGDLYVIERAAKFGGPALIRYLDCSGNTFRATETNEIDRGTGLVRVATLESGEETEFEYDMQGRMTRVAPHGQTPFNYSYALPNAEPADLIGEADWTRVAQTRLDPDGRTMQSSFFYDGFGRVAAAKDTLADGTLNYQKTTYDILGRVLSESTVVRDGTTPIHFTTYEYDAFGRPTKVTAPDNTKTLYEYSGIREEMKKQFSSGTTVWGPRYLDYDRQGRLIKVSELSEGTGSQATRYEYDPLDHLTGVFAGGASNARISMTYDGRGFLTSEKWPELGNAVTIEHDAFDPRGNPRLLRYAGGASNQGQLNLRYDYDAGERLTSVVRADSTGQSVIEFKYHDGTQSLSRGKLQTAVRHNQTEQAAGLGTRDYIVRQEYAYDGDHDGHIGTGNVSRILLTGDTGLPALASFSAVTLYEYDTNGNRRTVTYPDACAVPNCQALLSLEPSYAYGMMTGLPGFASYGYHPNGMVNNIHYFNGVKEARGIDSSGLPRIRQIDLSNAQQPSPGALGRLGPYVYDAAGNIREIGTKSGTPDTFTYDAVGRIDSATLAGLGTQTFSYDRWGNRTDTAPADPNTNRVTAWTYDFAGRVTGVPDTRLLDGSTAGTFLYGWDALGMLSTVKGRNAATSPMAVKTLRINLYDANNERVAFIEPNAAAGVSETWSVRGSDNQVLSDFKNTDSGWLRIRDYIHGAAGILAERSYQGSTATTLYFHDNHLGTPRFVTNAAGQVIDQRNYEPFGEEVGEHSDANRLKFTGHERDDDGTSQNNLGDLDYMHARFYSPVADRFLSIDPVLDVDTALQRPQSWSRYSYAFNNPVAYVDPDGRMVNLASMNDQDRALVISQLRVKTGMDLAYKGDMLISNGVLTDSSGKPLGSATARADLSKAINSKTTYYGLSVNDSDVDMGMRVGPILKLDFSDISKIDTGNNGPATFDAASIFLHELGHALGLKDPPRGMLKAVPNLRGANVDRDNMIRTELGLPLRLQYMTLTDSRGRYYIPFANGPVYVPVGGNH